MKTKKIIAAVAALTVICGAVPSQPFASIVKNSAVTASAETLSGFEFDAETGTITNYISSDTEVVIPSIIDGVAITSIGDGAFENCSSLKSVTIPDGVTSIGDAAFYECSALTSITIPDSVTSIGDVAFFHCSALTSITIPDSVISIGEEAFSECENLTISGYAGSAAETYAKENGFEFITLEKSETSSDFEFDAETGTIKKYYGSDAEVIIPSEINGVAVTAIGEAAFVSCKSVESIIIPDGVTSIGDNAFEGCENLNSITIPDGFTSIGDYAFRGCESLTSVTIPDSVTSIGNGAFAWCGINEITIPNSITSLSDGLFYYCVNLESITIPDSVTSIEGSAFLHCDNLTSITIPESVTSIGYRPFDYTPWLNAKRAENPLVIVNNILIDATACKGDVIIPDGVTTICDRAFDNCKNLKEITIPESVTSIGSFAFYSCGFSSVTIPDSVVSIGDQAFGWGYTTDGNGNFNGYKKIEGFTISGYAGSAAETYAKENGFEFISLGDAPTPEFILGDVDGDGAVTAMDASAALTYYVMNPESIEDLGFSFDIKAADWDGNGIINAIDASAILTYYVSNN